MLCEKCPDSIYNQETNTFKCLLGDLKDILCPNNTGENDNGG